MTADQATCPHVNADWDDDDWTCWDCGAYRDATPLPGGEEK